MLLVDKLVARSLRGGVPVVLLVLSMLAGLWALQFTPREEEPQIVVPMMDVMIEVPGLGAKQVERQITTPLEKLLHQIPGVEHVYSTSARGQALVTLRFYVGEDREDALLNTYNKLYSNLDQMHPAIHQWLLRPVEVDQVPILALGLWSEDPQRYSDYELRRAAEDLSTYIQSLPDTDQVKVVGGRPRTISIWIDNESMVARKTTALDVVNALQISNVRQGAGRWTLNNQSIQLEVGNHFVDVAAVRQAVVNVVDGVPVYLQDVARVVDGPAETESYTWINNEHGQRPMVAISVAKQAGTNAVSVAEDVRELVQQLEHNWLPPEMHISLLRDYGETANDKVNNLVSSLGFAVLTVIVFIGLFLGWRQALVVGLAVPVCYGITLFLDYSFGYTINRVTLFALILSLGLLVDDPITGVDNITRFVRKGEGALLQRVQAAMMEIRVPLVMSTLTIVLAFVPLAFITGMMGPYMAPMAFNVPVSVVVSTLVAFVLTPWLTSKLLGRNLDDETTERHQEPGFYRRLMSPILLRSARGKAVLWLMLLLFILACLLPVMRWVPLKLLPFDNKNELQVLIDMPENSSLEATAAFTQQVANQVKRLPEVTTLAGFVGLPSPIDFNGMVRHYNQRTGQYQAELRILLLDKTQREHQSHGIVLRLRELLAPLATNGVLLKVVEVPPGPPVLSMLTAEIYGDKFSTYEAQRRGAETLAERLKREPWVVEVDTSSEGDQARWVFEVDKTKAALSGISTADIAETLRMANDGVDAGYLQLPLEASPTPLTLRLSSEQRLSSNDLQKIQVKGLSGFSQQETRQGLDTAPQPLVALGELGKFRQTIEEKSIQHKDLRPVVYVMAELSGRTPADVIADVNADQNAVSSESTPWQQRTYLNNGGGDGWQLPDGVSVSWTGEGEWQITVDVFRDMGIAFAFALVAIFVVLRLQTGSVALSLIIMSSIPLTVIGILPGFWLLNQFGERQIAGAPEPVLFTATAMIGMIALAGIVVRNALILIEFITQARERGMSVREAVLTAGEVRMRPVLLTAGTTLLGNLIITLDPIFSGLAIAIIFGILASTLFTLMVVPVVYSLLYDASEQPAEEVV